ncbi:MAG: D-aspartate ligase [Actinomycetota bacterium]|nr:D-aspartate ligase [Actinomycetota bacterium]
MSAVSRPGGALLLGADYRALGVARSLGRHGVPVWVIAERAEPLASVSRYAQRSLRWPHGGDEERVAFLRELAMSNGLRGWALIPSSDVSAAMVARRHDDLASHYMHTTPPWDVLRWAYDKRLTYELAERVGVPCPVTLGRADALDAVRFPAVLKPAVKEHVNALTTAKAWRVDDADQLLRRHAEAVQLLEPDLLVVQELIPGGGETQLSYAALCRDGVPVASLSARRTRQYPADFGRASTFVETVECAEVVQPSMWLIDAMRYTGLIEIEYKRDPRDGVLKLLDMNPRVWGWHTLCGRAGVDFPWLLWLMISGQELPSSNARPGVGWIRFTTDTPTAVRELLGKRLTLREYARSLRRPRESAIFAWDDPLPGLCEVPVLAYVLARRLLSGDAV